MNFSPRWQDGDKWLKATETAELLSINRNHLEALMNQPFDPLPKPFPFGKTRRWLASQVWAWMERRMSGTPGNALVESVPTPQLKEAPILGRPCPAQELRQLYESGMTLDAICRDKRIGKARLLVVLREAGTTLRRPGRRTAKDCANEGASL